jgi:hypothetical protein
METRLGASGRFLGFGQRCLKGAFRLTVVTCLDDLFEIVRKTVL